MLFRLDRQQTDQDMAKGGIMIVCQSLLKPVICHPPQLEVVSITAISTQSGRKISISAVYKCPQQQLAAFLTLFDNYLADLPQSTPTIVLGDFNEDLLSRSSSSRLLQLMSSRGFSQLVQGPTTDSGSMLDHIYYSGSTDNTFVDVVDTYYSDHDATYLSFST